MRLAWVNSSARLLIEATGVSSHQLTSNTARPAQSRMITIHRPPRPWTAGGRRNRGRPAIPPAAPSKNLVSVMPPSLREHVHGGKGTAWEHLGDIGVGQREPALHHRS